MAVVISAELGINHQGDPDVAEKMIAAAKQAGADAVKVQSYREADIPKDNPEPQALIDCQIWPYLERLTKHAHKLGLLFGVTASSVEGVHEAVDVGADFLKNASEAILRHDLIDAMLASGLPTWVSTGMASAEEIKAVPKGAKLMLCTSLYPCPDDQANMARLNTGRFEGFSDHTVGSAAAIYAVAFGVKMIEKHVTLDTEMDGPDHSFSLDPWALDIYVQNLRKAEALRGDGVLGFVPGELEGRENWRMAPA